jgi:hypothetical protein
LQSRKASTFEKHFGTAMDDDMDELLGSSLKRPRHDRRSEVPTLAVANALRGHALTLMRKKLNRAYHLFKMEQLSQMSPLISKEEWFKTQNSSILPNYLELEQETRLKISNTYVNQRLRVLSGRKAKSITRINDLRSLIFSGRTYKIIREAKIAALKEDIIDLTGDLPKFTLQSTTKSQLNRVNVQCITVLNMFQQVELRIDSEASMLQDFLSGDHYAVSASFPLQMMLDKRETMKKKFRTVNSMCALSERAKVLTGSVISGSKIREWYNEYLERGTFEEDLRGSWKRDMFLEDFGYGLRFKMYLKNARKITVDIATKELESIITRDPPKCESGREAFDNLRPL